MVDSVPSGATNHFSFRELPGGRIILSEKVYARISADINLCGLSGSKELEYGTILYGKEIDANVIYFDVPSKFDDYVPSKHVFDLNYDSDGNVSKMYKELEGNTEGTKYDCIAHIHTHPYIGGTCRFFSDQDLDMIKSLPNVFKSSSGRDIYFFGGLITVGSDNLTESDELSFVFWDKNYGWYKITNVSVMKNGIEIPLNKFSDGKSLKMSL